MNNSLLKIFNVSQIRNLDSYTIENEPISSIDLMERASLSFVKWFTAHFDSDYSVRIFAGLGNNGGDGLAIARLLSQEKYRVELFIVRYAEDMSSDFRSNYNRLPHNIKKKEIISVSEIDPAKENTIQIDALLGSGLTRPPEGLLKDVISYINSNKLITVAVDIASGLFADRHTEHQSIITPDYTVSFQIPKLAFFFPENASYVGEWSLVDIGLSQKYIQEEKTDSFYITKKLVQSIYKKRKPFSHKGNYGKALLIAGSYGKMGAAVLAAKACLRAGVGLLTVQVPQKGVEILQTSVPEAMAITGKSKKNISAIDWKNLDIDSIGIGPGIGKEENVLDCLREVLKQTKNPMVIDADAINLLAENPDLFGYLPPNSVLTPHLKEFERLAGKSQNDFERIEKLKDFSKNKKIFTILKGRHTAIATPEGEIYFNGTGNAGMATGGSGDVLTGILLSLLAQGYSPLDASLFGVYIHGLSADLASKKLSQESLLPSDIIFFLSKVFLNLNI